MTRLMIAVVIAIVMAVLAIQNQETTALTILGAQQTPEIPFGLLLVGAFSIGSLLTIFLYGIVGLQRPPESKYKPMGRRVPYPESPNSANVPPSGPTTEATSPYATAGQSYSSSTAFVSDPAPQDTSGSTQNNYQAVSPQSGPQTSYSDSIRSPEARSPEASPSKTGSSNTAQSSYTPPVFPDVAANPAPSSVVDTPKAEKKKSRFNPLGKKFQSPPEENKRVGDDWGELRTAEHLNSWEAEDVRRASGVAKSEGGKRGLLDIIGVGSAASTPPAAERLTDDIAAGWDEGRYAYDDRYADGDRAYEDDLDSGWEQSYAQEGYVQDGYAPEGYAQQRMDVDAAADSASSAYGSPAEPQRRIYRDGLYSDDYSERAYEEGPYEEGPYEAGEDEGVYEADYRVIVPPSKPLEEVAGKEENEPYA